MTYTTWAYQDSISYLQRPALHEDGLRELELVLPWPNRPAGCGLQLQLQFDHHPTRARHRQLHRILVRFVPAGDGEQRLAGPASSRRLTASTTPCTSRTTSKSRPNLTLNLGVRYDYNPLAFEAHDRITSWDPTEDRPVGEPSGRVRIRRQVRRLHRQAQLRQAGLQQLRARASASPGRRSRTSPFAAPTRSPTSVTIPARLLDRLPDSPRAAWGPTSWGPARITWPPSRFTPGRAYSTGTMASR